MYSKQKMSNAAAITQGKWSTRDVHDTKFNEDKLSIQFRTGRLGKKLNAPYEYRKNKGKSMKTHRYIRIRFE